MSRMDVSHHVLQQENLQNRHSAGQLNAVKRLAEQKNKDSVGEFHMGESMCDTRVTLLFKAALSSDAPIILQCEMICIRRRTRRLNLFLLVCPAKCFWCLAEEMVPLNRGVCTPEASSSRGSLFSGASVQFDSVAFGGQR